MKHKNLDKSQEVKLMSDSTPKRMDRNKNSKGKKKGGSLWKKIIAIIAILGALMAIAVGIYLFTILDTLDDLDPDSIVNYNQTSLVYDSQDNLVSSIHGIENRIYVPLSQIPKHVQDAFIAVEDVRFRTHPGFDIRRMFGSLLQNIKAQGIVAGASTITQQLVRNTVLTQEQKIDRKVKEIILAWQLEQKYSKDQILEMYLNVIYFAEGAYGIEAASKTYFGKTVSELTLAEGGLLVGVINNPHRNSPFINEKRSLEKKDQTIDIMVSNGYLTAQEGEKAKNEEIKFAENVKPAYIHGYFMDMVLEEAASLLNVGLDELYTGGYRIYTTMDKELQEYVEQLYAQEDLFPKSPVSGETSESALVVMDTDTGELVAVMGGRSYPEGQRYVLNRANARRLPGSVIKPIVAYIPAVELFDYNPVTFIDDSPITIGNYTPRNAGGGFNGIVTMREALSRSLNIPAVKTLQEIGISTGISLAEKMGVPFTEGDHHYPALALGGMEQGTTPIEIARAFASLGDRGSYKEETTIRRIDDSHGKTVYQSRISKEQIFSEETAFVINDILQTAADTGTAYRLKGLKLAAKTGTVQLPKNLPEYAKIKGNNDAWVVAYNPEYTAVVWMGFDKRSTENHLPSDASGGKYTTLIAKELFEHIYEGKELPDFQKPVGISEVKLDKKALEEQKRVVLASALTPDEYVATEYFKRGAEPTEQSDYWVVPSAPYNFSVTLNENENPVVSFVPRESFAVYNIIRTTGESEQASFVNQIKTGALDPVHWTDTQVSPGETYGYYVIPVHPEMKLGGEAVQGPQTEVIYIDIPAKPLPGEDIWDNIWDWLNPRNSQDDDDDNDNDNRNNDDINEESPEGPKGDPQDDADEETAPPAA